MQTKRWNGHFEVKSSSFATLIKFILPLRTPVLKLLFLSPSTRGQRKVTKRNRRVVCMQVHMRFTSGGAAWMRVRVKGTQKNASYAHAEATPLLGLPPLVFHSTPSVIEIWTSWLFIKAFGLYGNLSYHNEERGISKKRGRPGWCARQHFFESPFLL
jgi:hypothetical protein